MKVIGYERRLRDDWDDLVLKARQDLVLFRRRYIDYHSDRFEDASVIVTESGEPSALFPATRIGDTLQSHAGLTYGGLISPIRFGLARTLKAYSLISGWAKTQGFRRIEVKVVPHIYHRTAAQEELIALTEQEAELKRREVSVAIDLASESRLSSERSRAIRKGSNQNLVMGFDPAIPEYHRLLSEVLSKRHGVAPVHSQSELEYLVSQFPKHIQLFTAREQGGELLAGVLVFRSTRVAHCQYIASSDRGRELAAQDALFSWLIDEERASSRWFDFGSCTRRDGSIDLGLVRYKEGFGARCVVQDTYAIAL